MELVPGQSSTLVDAHLPKGVTYHAQGATYPGYTLFANAAGGIETWGTDIHAFLVDMEGRVCHRWEHAEGIRYARMLPNGNLMIRTRPAADQDGPGGKRGAATAIVELDWDSQVVWSFRNGYLHHDWLRLDNGNTLVLLWERIPADVTAKVKGGHSDPRTPERMFCDLVQEIRPDGTVAWEWHAWEHLDFDTDVICRLEGREEWTHANSLSVTPSGDILISFRSTDTVALIEKSSGAIKWRWGKGQISHQHGAVALDSGNVLLFDNGTHRPSIHFSRVVEVDPRTDKIVWEYKGNPLTSFYSFHLSGADRLPNGNTLVTNGSQGRIIEVNRQSETVWEYFNPIFVPCLHMGHTNWIFRAHRYGLEHPGLQGRVLDPARYEELNRGLARSAARAG